MDNILPRGWITHCITGIFYWVFDQLNSFARIALIIALLCDSLSRNLTPTVIGNTNYQWIRCLAYDTYSSMIYLVWIIPCDGINARRHSKSIIHCWTMRDWSYASPSQLEGMVDREIYSSRHVAIVISCNTDGYCGAAYDVGTQEARHWSDCWDWTLRFGSIAFTTPIMSY